MPRHKGKGSMKADMKQMAMMQQMPQMPVQGVPQGTPQGTQTDGEVPPNTEAPVKVSKRKHKIATPN